MPHFLLHSFDNSPSTRLEVLPGGWPIGWKGKSCFAKSCCDSIGADGTTESSFFIVDLDIIIIQYRTWQAMLPHIKPYFTVRSQPDPTIIQLLAALGCGFNCQTVAAMKLVTNLGVPAEDIILSHPCKTRSTIRTAADIGIPSTVTDSVADMKKLARDWPGVQVLLRIFVPSVDSENGIQFGAAPEKWASLGSEANKLGLSIVGVSFDVGPNSTNTNMWSHAVVMAAEAFRVLRSEVGGNHKMSMLDIGGGFPGDCAASSSKKLVPVDKMKPNPLNFQAICSTIRNAIDRHFPPQSGVQIIAEPGRFFTQSALHLVTQVINKQTCADPATKETSFNYTLNDGVYGSFKEQLGDGATLLRPLSLADTPTRMYLSSIRGPTPDEDPFVQNSRLPEVEVGDYLLWPNMGHNTVTVPSGTTKHYYLSEQCAPTLRQTLRPQLDDSGYTAAVRRLRLRTGSGSESGCGNLRSAAAAAAAD